MVALPLPGHRASAAGSMLLMASVCSCFPEHSNAGTFRAIKVECGCDSISFRLRQRRRRAALIRRGSLVSATWRRFGLPDDRR